MRRSLLLALSLLCAATTFAQQVPIGPALHAQMRQQQDVQALDGDERHGVIIHTRDADALVRAGVDVQAHFGPFVTARLRPGDLARVAALPGVLQIDNPIEYLHNDVAAGLTGAQALRSGLIGGASYTGRGVLVCIIDSGIDWRHGDFRDPADPSKSRILRIWDQTLLTQFGESTPADFSYGVEYTRAHVEAALAGGPALRTQDVNGHGTHVAGTAAGNGASLSPAQHVGMAPEADLVVVKGGDVSFAQSNVTDAIAYCDGVATAEGKPVVINMSLGSDDGPHDGTDAKSQAINLVAAKPGRAVVQSAGNSGGAPLHRHAVVPAGGSLDLTFTVPSYTPLPGAGNDNLGLDLWFDAAPGITATLRTPGGTLVTAPAQSAALTPTPDGAVTLYNVVDLANGDRRIYLTVRDDDATRPPAPGTWTLTLTSTSGAAEGLHAWIFDNEIGEKAVALAGADSDYTIANAAASGITVGSYVHRWRFSDAGGSPLAYIGTERSNRLSSFSSRGPSRTGLTMPHLVAPGQAVISSRSSTAVLMGGSLVAGGQHHTSQGTSMSAPVVSGLVALLFQQNPALTGVEVQQRLRDAADVDEHTGPVPNNSFGAGKVNAYTAMAHLVSGTSTPGMQVRAYDGNLTGATGIGAGGAFAVRFSHTLGHDGRLRGLLFHPSAIVPATGTLSLGLFADDGTGRPGVQIGSGVDVPMSTVDPYTWNYLDLTATNAEMVSGADYHLVLRALGTDDALFLLHDGATDTGRSLAEAGGAWSVQPFDLGMRPVVTSTEAALPVELVLFEGTLAAGAVALRWTTASETNNAGFHVEMRASEAAWQEIGFVAGHGTTAEAQRYQFHTPTLAPGSYRFRLRQVDTDGAFTYSGTVEVSVEADRALALYRDGPNPSADGLQVRFTVPRSAPARVEAYDALGRRVGVLFDGTAEAGQVYRATLRDDGLAAGLYVVRLVQEGAQQTQTFVLTR